MVSLKKFNAPNQIVIASIKIQEGVELIGPKIFRIFQNFKFSVFFIKFNSKKVSPTINGSKTMAKDQFALPIEDFSASLVKNTPPSGLYRLLVSRK